ncbi:hypothetical protein CDEST_02024 [Colletotrichum destructivum]|uniref:Uncharacterized protein n=1 Tax=Colletotrichum destructivum TaxID=34406 RepID=A0AAX4I205_9PEZI|nr:hypothetical protein CDEST_02024 [Colletotrichum destructivum]
MCQLQSNHRCQNLVVFSIPYSLTTTEGELAKLRQQLRRNHRREEAEELAITSRPQTLQAYLEACHSFSLAIQVVTDRSLTTQGHTINPTGRVFPRRIILWDDFATAQDEVWAHFLDQQFSSQPLFPSQHRLDYVMSLVASKQRNRALELRTRYCRKSGAETRRGGVR